MGADLYIKSITDKAEKKFEPLFSEACQRRNALQRDVEVWQTIANARQSMVGAIPSADRELKAAQDKIAALKAQVEAAQAEVSKYYNRMYPSSGYYRDSYNGTSVLWRLELSWWKDIPGGKLTVAQLRESLAKIKAAKFQPITAEELREHGCKVDDDKNSPAVWNKYFQNKKRRLVRFFERAIRYREQGSEVYFSL